MKLVKNAFGGVIGGIILLLVGIGLLWFNESNNVKNIKAVAEGRKVAINVSSTSVDSKNNDKLVNISGDLNILSENTKDSIFNIGIKTTKLVRTVEMYEWDEKEDNSNDNTTYSYSKGWSDELIDSSSFNQPDGHQNPTSMPYESGSFIATDVKVGDFVVSDKQKDMLPTSKVLNPLPTDVVVPTNYKIDNKYITSSVDSLSPQVGDVRISFSYNDAKTVTILAGQSDNTFTNYQTTSGKSINMIREGKYTATQMLDYLETQNNILKWVLRAVGTILIIAGIAALFGPLTMIARFVPILGDLVGFAVFLVAFISGLAISLTTIAIAWIVYRPVLGVLLLIGSISLFVLLSKYIRGKRTISVVNQTISAQPVMQNNNPVTPTIPVNNVQTPVTQQTPIYPENNIGIQNNQPIEQQSTPQNNINQDINNNSILH